MGGSTTKKDENSLNRFKGKLVKIHYHEGPGFTQKNAILDEINKDFVVIFDSGRVELIPIRRVSRIEILDK